MHLSMLTDGFLSDTLNDSGSFTAPSAGRDHRDGVVRGLCFFAILGATVALFLGAIELGDVSSRAFPASVHSTVLAQVR